MKENYTTYFRSETFALIDGTKVEGIFDNEYFQAVNGVGVETEVTVFICETINIQKLNHKDKLIVDGVKYDIIEVQPDGTGVTLLRLHKA